MKYPLWATPERQAKLLEVFHRTGGRCVYGHRPCPNPSHYYESYIDGIIEDWVADDRAERAALLRRETQLLHQAPDKKGWGRRFDPVAREQFLDHQPLYYLEAVGSGCPIFSRVAKIRVPSTYLRLFVDVARSKEPSKNQRRKARRYGLTLREQVSIENLCIEAVKDLSN